MIALPIDHVIPEVKKALRAGHDIILHAPPGSGKTTRVPPACLGLHENTTEDLQTREAGEVLVLEPRRLAAVMAARRVAEELGQELGEQIGYHVRFESRASQQTKVRFLTEGMLSRWIIEDPHLKKVSVVILDEFHERHLQGDLAFTLLLQLKKTYRPDLRLIIMSATLSVEELKSSLPHAVTIETHGRQYPVSIRYQEAKSVTIPLEQQVLTAFESIESELTDDCLVFLPGSREIRRCLELFTRNNFSHRYQLESLHGELSLAEQKRVLSSGKQQKIIFATNIAESSLTLPGVRAVIDSGLARISSTSISSGITKLEVERVSQASAIQRTGRAGRLGPGVCVRLYSQADFAMRPQYSVPEIARADLSDTILLLTHLAHQAQLPINTLVWVTPPDAQRMKQAKELLFFLGALEESPEERTPRVTALGKLLLRFPLHPRFSRLLYEGYTQQLLKPACDFAAILSEKDFYKEQKHTTAVNSDLLERYKVLDLYRRKSSTTEADRFALERVILTAQRLYDIAVNVFGIKEPQSQKNISEEQAAKILIPSFADRAAMSLKGTESTLSKDFRLASGEKAVLSNSSAVTQSQYILALDTDERRAQGRLSSEVQIRLAAEIKPEWLWDIPAIPIKEISSCTWDAQEQKVLCFQKILFNEVILEETKSEDPLAGKLLFEMAQKAGLDFFLAEDKATESLHKRIQFAERYQVLPTQVLETWKNSVLELCSDKRSFAQLRQAIGKGGLVDIFKANNFEQYQEISKALPEFISLPRRHKVPVNYDLNSGGAWVESRLQDYLGLQGPLSICSGKIKLTLHLLAPNMRAVQVTQDLSSFWKNHYPQLRKELMRRYPRHDWPENPA